MFSQTCLFLSGVTFRVFLSYFVFPFKIKTKISGDSKPFSKKWFSNNKKTSLAFLSGKRIITENAGSTNLVEDHLSRLEGESDEVQVNDDFPDERLLAIEDKRAVPWFADYVNYLVAKVVPPEFNYQQKKRFFRTLETLLLGGANSLQTLR